MAIPVKLEIFEGPLDLLLHLIDKNKVNIYDIPIVLITEQYMEYVDAMDRTDLNVVSEFLVMAATLLNIKAKMLLPAVETNEEGEAEDPRQELVQKLLEYKMYKYMSYELKDRYIDADKAMYKKPTIPQEVEEYRPPFDMHELLEGVTLAKLRAIFEDVMKRQEDKIDPQRSKFGKIEKEEVNLDERIDYVRSFAMGHSKFSFRELLEGSRGKMKIIVTFLAVLELIKGGLILVEQESRSDDITIILKQESVVG